MSGHEVLEDPEHVIVEELEEDQSLEEEEDDEVRYF